MKKQKKLIRLASMILQAISQLKKQHLRQLQNDMDIFSQRCSEVSRDSHLFNMAVERNWSKSAKKIKTRIGRNLNNFSSHLQQFTGLINADRGRLPKLSDIYAELNQLEQEFGELQFDLSEKTISVITDPITLEGVSLGDFEIELNIDEICRLYKDSPYKVLALNPNPAAANDDVTHPHVSCEKLCEGDGYTAIRRAIEDGRLNDFFTMIVNILQTYNPSSPYVALGDWEGSSCYDCGYIVSGDDSYYCENCDRDYCSQCSTCCQQCDTSICLGCAYECPGCEEPVCKSCTEICKECEETFCKDCLSKETLCKDCDKIRKDNSNEEQENESETPETHTAVLTDSLGEIALHA